MEDKSENTSRIISYTPCETATSADTMIYVTGAVTGCSDWWPTFSQYPFPTYNVATKTWTFQYHVNGVGCDTKATINWQCEYNTGYFITINASYSHYYNENEDCYYQVLEWFIASQYACVDTKNRGSTQ